MSYVTEKRERKYSSQNRITKIYTFLPNGLKSDKNSLLYIQLVSNINTKRLSSYQKFNMNYVSK